MDSYQVTPIGKIQSPYKEKFGTPRQPGLANEVQAMVSFFSPYNDHNAFKGLAGFDYIWLVFLFHEAKTKSFSPCVRPPRLGGNQKLGVFATRSPFRPNSIGLSLVKLEEIKIVDDKVELLISGHDLIDETPILDIKPYIAEVESLPHAQIGWTKEVVKNENLPVIFTDSVSQEISSSLREEIISFLKLDPRPSYQDDERVYKNKYDIWDIVWKVEEGSIRVIALEQLSS